MHKPLTLCSLFSGSGGFELAALLCGIRPVSSSEVEPFPIRVTTKRMPFVKPLGDINKINGSEIEPVDIITFGSPCQDMSVAGKREGLDGERSGLFYQAVRIVKEMREATDGRYPRYIVWENVPGAFSSNKGADFEAVLREIAGIKGREADIPGSDKWAGAGLIMAEDLSIAWRLLDAQYWGVPQRRKRIYLVADLDGGSAGKILFESEGVSGYSAESFRAWQRAAGSSAEGTGEAGCLCLNDQGGNRMDVTEDKTSTLRAQANHPPLVFENHAQDSRYTGPLDKSQTVLATFGTGGNNQPLVMQCFGICSKDSNSMKSDNPKSGFYIAETSRTLDGNGGNPSCNQGGIAVVEGNGSRPSHHGDGYKEDDVMYTLNATEQHGVAFAEPKTLKIRCGKEGGGKGALVQDNKSATFSCNDDQTLFEPTWSASKASFFTCPAEEVAGALVATDYKDPPLVNDSDGCEYIVRRLTPTECARLQGFPDWWCSGLETPEPSEQDIESWKEVFETHRKVITGASKPKTRAQIVKWLKDPHSDSAEYKMWGNGVALPNVVFVLAGIAYFSEKM
jgi:DNA (cytosine-5)-methyltransferase 1